MAKDMSKMDVKFSMMSMMKVGWCKYVNSFFCLNSQMCHNRYFPYNSQFTALIYLQWSKWRSCVVSMWYDKLARVDCSEEKYVIVLIFICHLGNSTFLTLFFFAFLPIKKGSRVNWHRKSMRRKIRKSE